ncbi:MAG: type IV pilus secretin PilQ [Elusimicrobiota bacterium]
MNKKFLLILTALFLVAARPVVAKAEASDFYLLKGIKLENNVLKITTTGKVKYNVFRITNPPRLVVELFNTEHDIKEKETVVQSEIIKRIRSAQFQNEPTKIARVVLDLAKTVDYSSTQEETIITVLLMDAAKTSETKTAETKTAATDETAVASAGTTAAAPAATPPVIVEKPKETSKPKTTIAKTAKKSTVVKKQTAAPKPPGIVLPKTPVTLEYQDADIRDVLQVMAIRSGINIIYGTDVTGTLTISLKNVPFDQAFRTILSLKGLASVPVGDNILRVITPVALTAERQQDISFTKVYPLNYALAGEIQSQIASALGAQGLKLSLSPEVKTNALVVTASPDGLNMVEKLLKELDVRPKQVMIESRVVDVRIDDLAELGVNWSLDKIQTTDGSGVTMMSRSGALGGGLALTMPGETVAKVEGGGVSSVISAPTSGGVFNFGYITNRDAFLARLGMLATQGKTKVLSNPRVSTINNKEASILVGEKVPYKTTTIGTGGVSQESWQYLDAGIQLTVTPTISPDGWVTLKVNPTVSVPLPTAGGAAPTVRTRETKVTVMVKDGDTIVIGGLISETDINSIQKIPLLGDLPILGHLFKYTSSQKGRTELLIFLTPHILED